HAGFTQIIDLDTGKQVDPGTLPAKSDDKAGKAPCVFASLPHLSAPQATVDVEAPSDTMQAATLFKVAVTPGRGIAAPPPPSTGPPSLT
ncbi:MAG: hypothetical protein ABMA14_18110, partial [Hyphomonadaceae bacterium]